MANYSINLETISWPATEAIFAVDQKFIGSRDYLGIVYFWHYDYRHTLRDVSVANRKLVHKKLLDANLNVTGNSPEHTAIIKRYAKPKN